MDVEYSTLCKVIDGGGFDILAAARITDAFFMDEENLRVFQWMHEHWNRHGVSPGHGAFTHEFPHLSVIETPEPLDYYLDELRDQRKYALVMGAIDEIKEPLGLGNANQAVKILHAALDSIHLEVNELQDEDLTETAGESVEYYDRLGDHVGILGWPTGFPSIDQATNGLQAEQLVTLVGLQKRYKSMVLMCMDIAAHKAGARTMFASFEMTNLEQRTRHHALRSGISLTRLQRGQHRPEERKMLVRMTHEVDGMQPFMLVHDPGATTTVSSIAAKIRQHKPDIVFIDGTYLMDSEVPNVQPNSPQALTSITRSLKRLAQRDGVAIVQTTQALSWKARAGKLSLDSIGYSSSYAQDSDVILGVEEIRENGEISDKEATLRILASRNCPPRNVRLAIDLDRGAIIETDDMVYEPDDDLDNEQ